MATKQKSANSEEPRIDVQSEVKGKVMNEGRESLMLREANLIPSETMDDDEVEKTVSMIRKRITTLRCSTLFLHRHCHGWLAAL
jgi:hypothetical protein